MGEVCRHQGKFDEAMDYYDRSLKIKFQMVGHDHPDVAKTYNK